jgi:hypothetical protein
MPQQGDRTRGADQINALPDRSGARSRGAGRSQESFRRSAELRPSPLLHRSRRAGTPAPSRHVARAIGRAESHRVGHFVHSNATRRRSATAFIRPRNGSWFPGLEGLRPPWARHRSGRARPRAPRCRCTVARERVLPTGEKNQKGRKRGKAKDGIGRFLKRPPPPHPNHIT